MSILPKKIKLIRDKYPSHIGTIYNLMYKKKVGFNENYFYTYIHNLEKDESEDKILYNTKDGIYSRRRPEISYEGCYKAVNGDEITLNESKETYWFEPIEIEEPTEMTLKEVQNKLGIKNLIIKNI